MLRAAQSAADLDAATRLVVEVWQKAGLPSPRPIGGGEDSVVLLVEEDGEPAGTMTLVFRGVTAIACRFAIRRKSVLSAWSVLVAGALQEMARRKVQIMATTVNPATQRRWQECLGLVTVERGLYVELGNVPAVVMVGSVDAMCKQWDQYRGRFKSRSDFRGVKRCQIDASSFGRR